MTEKEQADVVPNRQAVFVGYSLNDTEAIPMLLALCCGLRMSEILALSPQDFDHKNNIIFIHKARVKDEKNHLVEKTLKQQTAPDRSPYRLSLLKC